MDPREIREWALDNGYVVGIRGRLSREVIFHYLAAHPRDAKAYARLTNVSIPKRGRMSDKARMELAAVIQAGG